MRFEIRDLLWLMLVVAAFLGGVLYERRVTSAQIRQLQVEGLYWMEQWRTK